MAIRVRDTGLAEFLRGLDFYLVRLVKQHGDFVVLFFRVAQLDQPNLVARLFLDVGVDGVGEVENTARRG